MSDQNVVSQKIDQQASFLDKKLDIKGYGTTFVLYRDNLPMPQDEVRKIILDAIMASANIFSYRVAWNEAMREGDRPEWQVAEVSYEKESGLRFEHLIDWDVVLPSNIDVRSCSAKDARKLSAKQSALAKKLDLIKTVDGAVYLTHVNQCGFLVAHLDLMFIHTKNQWLTSVQTRVRGLPLAELKLFVDAAGQCSLQNLSTHIGDTEDWEMAEGMHKQFAIDLVDFMGIEGILDIDDLLKHYLQSTGNTGYKSIETFGAKHDLVLKQMQDRRKDLDGSDIAEYFNAGRAGTLL